MHVSHSLKRLKPLIALFVVVTTVLAIIPLIFWDNNLIHLYMHSLIPAISFISSFVLIYTAWWSYKNRRDVFKPWFFIAIAITLYSIANLFYFVFEDFLGIISSPSLGDAFYLATYPFLILGLLFFLKRPFKIKFKSLLDTAIVMISAFFIVWFPLVWPIVEPSQPNTITMIISLFYIFLDIIIMFLVLTLLFNQNKKINDLPLLLMSLGIFVQIFGDIIYAYWSVEPTLIYEWIFNVFYAFNFIFILLAAISFLKDMDIDLDYLMSSYQRSDAQNALISYLPLILVLFTYSLLIITNPDAALIWGVGIVVVLVIIRQIVSLNEIKQNKELISQKNEQLGFITTNMMDLITESDEKGILKYVSPSCEQVLGYYPEDMLGKPVNMLIHPDDLSKMALRQEKAVNSRGSMRLQYRIKTATEEYIWMETVGKPVFESDILKGFIYSSRDITEQVKSAEFVKNSLEEKETLLREIHHRVNNNLQIITSLLNIQSMSVLDPGDQELFRESQRRVRAMAMVHEKLYQSDDLSSIDLSDYIKLLVTDLIYENYYNLSKIDLDLDIEEINMNIETSIPFGLIINELVSNSLKHTFPEGNGKITVKLHGENDRYILMVGDNAPSSAEDGDLSDMALKLVNMLVRQVDGQMEIINDGGIFYRIKFRELKYNERI